VSEPSQPPAGAPREAGTAAERVGSILAAAEAAAERIRSEAERRLSERIAEAEARSRDMLAAAESEAAAQRTTAASEALAAVGRAQENAEAMLAEARAEAERVRFDAESRARTQIREARDVAGEVKSEGLELVANLREMGDVLRSNAERLLRDVQGIHSRMVSELDQGDATLGAPPPETRSRGASSPAPPRRPPAGDLDVPEFIPPG